MRHIQHDCKLDDLWAGFEDEEGDIFSYVQAANSLHQKGKAVCSDRDSEHDSYQRVFGWIAKSWHIKGHTICGFTSIFF